MRTFRAVRLTLFFLTCEVLSVVLLFASAILASGVFVATVAMLRDLFGLDTRVLLIVAPALYAWWVTLFAIISALEMRVVGVWFNPP
jgi:hypothetical protein